MKKMLSVLLASAMAISAVGGLAACGSNDANKITVWAPSESHEAYQSLVAGWKAANPEYEHFDIEFVAKGEGDVKQSLGTDPASGAEIFFFASDHFGDMLANNYLQPLTKTYADRVTKDDIESCVEFVTNNNNIYAFPATNDNGFFLWYDSSFYTNPEDVTSLDTMQSMAKAEGKHIMFDYGTAWYCPAFYIGAGLNFGYTDVEMKHFQAQLDGPVAEGVTIAMWNYFSEAKNGSGDAAVITKGDLAAGFAEGDYVAGVSGTWEYDNIVKQMTKAGKDSKNIKATRLPNYKATISGEEKTFNIGTFYGGKYCGVNSSKSEEKVAASLSLADWFTNEKGQEARFDAQKAGPSNKKVAALEKVVTNMGVAALLDQTTHGNNLVQGAQSDAFWGSSGISSLLGKIAEQDESVNTEAKLLAELANLRAGLNT